MSRQEALNTFTEGLVMDLNPLTTPNNVLTDCLNGTLITYNDNEFILQNDQGNYKLENCKLKPNFIPVGIKAAEASVEGKSVYKHEKRSVVAKAYEAFRR